jgi:lipid-A-disaccharide synthase-like uncharacterized protein
VGAWLTMDHPDLMEKGLLALGFLAQGLFSARFLVQWIASERAGRSVVPLSFWLFSVAGGGLLLLYAIFRNDPVFIVGQGAGLIIYLRNLFLIYKEKTQPKLLDSSHQPPVQN